MSSSYVFVNAGQCGNQLGLTLLNKLLAHINEIGDSIDTREIYFRESSRGHKLYARCVSLDTEPKVINECIELANSSNSWLLDVKSAAYMHGGAGNNWALGYDMCSGDFMTTSLNCIRRELEYCDRPPSLLLTHALAGGTGSGMGTRLTEACRDEFPDVSRLNISITPYHFGEVIVMHFNALFALSKLANASDAILLFENEVAQGLCKQMKGIDRPTLGDINAVIASNILPMLLPKYSVDRFRCSEVLISDDLTHLCSHPGYRFLDIKNSPQTFASAVQYTHDSWSGIVGTLIRMQILGTSFDRGLSKVKIDVASSDGKPGVVDETCPTLTSVLTLRGPDAADGAAAAASAEIASLSLDTINSPHYARKTRQLQPSSSSAFLSFKSTIPFASAVCPYDPVKIYHDPHAVGGYSRSASVLSNSAACVPLLSRVTTKAADLYKARAYVHQYMAHGLDDDHFVEAFRMLGQVVENYRGLRC